MNLPMHPILILFGLALTGATALAAGPDAARLYAEHCAACHGTDRLGGMGPALLPENLARLKREAAVAAVRDGRIATQMPGFGATLDAAGIEALVDYVYTPLPAPPRWELAEIAASRVVHVPPGTPASGRPVFKVRDPLNLFIVVELGDHHATLLDGDRFEPIRRFPTRFALHGGPKYSPDGRYVYFASRDGWVSKFDIYNLRYVAEIRAGINTRNLAVSSDGRYVMVANYLPHTLVALDAADLRPIRVIAVRDRNGSSSRVSAVYDAAPRKSFIAALKDVPEAWELPYADDAEPVYEGLVHDHALGEAIPVPGPFPVRRIPLREPVDDFFFDPPYEHLVGAGRDSRSTQVIDLYIRRRVAELELPGMPHLGSGISFEYQGRPVLATPNLKEGVVSIVDMKDWKVIRRIDTLGPGFFLRSHEATPYAWADNMMSRHKDTLDIIDKRTLAVVKRLTPAPGQTAAHVEFTRDGRYALVSVWENDGALVVYDARTFREVKRLTMNKPSGKYNVYNKITRSEGTSH